MKNIKKIVIIFTIVSVFFSTVNVSHADSSYYVIIPTKIAVSGADFTIRYSGPKFTNTKIIFSCTKGGNSWSEKIYTAEVNSEKKEVYYPLEEGDTCIISVESIERASLAESDKYVQKMSVKVPCSTQACATAVIDNTGAGGPAVIDPGAPSAGTGVNINTGIQNPIAGVADDIPQLITAILNFVLIIGVPIVALAIIYSGFLFVTAQGNSEKLTVAKKTLLYTLVGAALLLGCLVITKAIQGTVDEIKKTS